MIEVRHLTKQYGESKAIDDLSFTLREGTVYGFLGQNGAGKSTTMNIMTGYLSATNGSVTVYGYDIFRDAQKARAQIGYLPEIPPLYPDMTVREYLSFVAELKQIPRGKRRDAIASAMKKTMTGDHADRMIRNLSKGYRQRVGIAQALIASPKVIILDEPTVGLDPQQIMEVRQLIGSLKQDHVVILSSHILSEISAVCDEIIILHHGKLLAQGTLKELEEQFPDTSGQQITLQMSGTKELAKKALQVLQDAGIRDASVREQKPSLEEIFLRLTGEADSRHESNL